MPLPTPVGEYTVYTVRSGDTLSVIAMRYGISMRTLIRANRIANANLLQIGQQIYIPAEDLPFVTVTPSPGLAATVEGASPEPTSSPEPGAPATDEVVTEGATTSTAEQTPESQALPNSTGAETPTQSPTPTLPPQPMELGIALYTSPQSVEVDSAVLTALGAQWAKLTADWSDLEAVPGVIDYSQLDAAVDALNARGIQVLLTISGAPDWTRSAHDESGPPDDFSLFAEFLTEFASHYVDRIQAYEIWDEPNLRREWNSAVHPLSAASYAELLRAAYPAIKAGDSTALVISGGLAPTGMDDGFNAINDRRFLTELLQAGLNTFADGIGLHPYGFGNPPDVACCEVPEGVESHTGDVSFYFQSMLDAYAQAAMMVSPALPLWITSFGWGVAEPGQEVLRNFIYVTYNTPEEQAAFTTAALDMGKDLGIVRVMILSNLNGCAFQTDNAEVCYLSINPTAETPRPLFEALRERARAQQ
ncbi:MAG: LysM peptidoglycan-binding domain-containing protein [Chloroflexi bacterium]|nr:LysM peptidoglycan-binding domain-containing protein [Chloroflexota bacterium]